MSGGWRHTILAAAVIAVFAALRATLTDATPRHA